MKRLVAFLFLCLAAPAFAAGEVVFMVNMNYSPEEMAAAKKAAQARGQEFVMVPPESDVRAGNDAGDARADLINELKKAKPGISETDQAAIASNALYYGTDGISDPALRRRLGSRVERYRALTLAVQETEGKRGTIKSQIQEKLRELKAAGKRVDSFLVSAHSDGATLSGETSYALEQTELSALKSAHPELFEVRHVLLLGCYTTTETSTMMWREHFPGASLIAGFEGRAPSRKRPAASNFITDVMAAADRLDKENMRRQEPLGRQAVTQALRALESVRITTSAIDYCTHRVEGIPGVKVSCDDQWLTFGAMVSEMDRRFLSTENPTENPPREVSGTVLRSFYNRLQALCPVENTSYPEDQKQSFKALREQMRDRTLRMIFWWNVHKNFGVYYERDINALSEEMKQLDINEPLPKLDGSLGRKEFLKQVYAVSNGFARKFRDFQGRYASVKDVGPDASDEERAAVKEKREAIEREYAKVQAASERFSQLFTPLVTMEAKGIPQQWVEPDAAFSMRRNGRDDTPTKPNEETDNAPAPTPPENGWEIDQAPAPGPTSHEAPPFVGDHI